MCLLYAFNNLVRCKGDPDLVLGRSDMTRAAMEFANHEIYGPAEAKNHVEKRWLLEVIPLALKNKYPNGEVCAEPGADPVLDSDNTLGYIMKEPMTRRYVSFS